MSAGIARNVARVRDLVSPRMVDAAVAVAVGAAELVNLYREVSVVGYEPPLPLIVVAGWLIVISGLLFWRRRWPLGVLIAVGLAAGAYAVIDLPTLSLPVLAAVLSAGAGLGAVTAVGVGLAAGVGAVNLLRGTLSQLPIDLVVFGAVWLLGVHLRARQLHARDLERRREAELWRARSQERTRLARELHDIVSNGVGGIYLQAVGAAGLFDDDPQRARVALDTIKSSARATLDELRRLLDILRIDTDSTGAPDRAPTPTLTELDRLVDRARATGATVQVDVDGDLTGLPPSISSTGYRVVQEALGNAIRHGDGDVRARLARTSARLHIEVNNPVVAPNARLVAGEVQSDERWGLTGMRERVRAMGGRVQAEERDGQFHLEVRLPVTEASGTR